MVKSYFVLVALLIATTISSCAQSGNGPRLIVRGDDMGFSHSGNEALIKCSREGIQTSIEVLVPSPWFPEAVRLLEENPDIDVGIHLTLTSEWDNIKWRPVSASPNLTEEDGYLHPFIWPNDNYPGRALLDGQWKIEDIEREFRAQIELAIKRIPRISHVSGHMGCTGLNDEVRALTKKLTREYNIDIDMTGVDGARFEGPHETSAEKKQSFIKMLRGLKAGKTYMFVEHPGINTPELQAISHIGYESVAVDRQGVTDVWTDPEIKALVQELGIELISYADLRKD